jgi:hypothetical protein
MSHDDHGENLNRPGGRSAMAVPTATSIGRREREISVSQPESSRAVMFLAFMRIRLLLFACS